MHKMLARRRAFTLTEFFVIIGVIAILFALLVPLFNSSHHRGGRRAMCSNHMHNIGFAILRYEMEHGEYPGYCDSLQTDDRTNISRFTNPIDGAAIVAPAKRTAGKIPVSWLVKILPQLERPDLDKLWKTGAYVTNSSAQFPGAVDWVMFSCPSNPSGSASAQPLSYVVNAGQVDVTTVGPAPYPADWPANGVFTNRYAETLWNPAYKRLVGNSRWTITQGDGLSTTLMVSENNQAQSWNYRNGHMTTAAKQRSTAAYGTAEAMLTFLWHPTQTVSAVWKINGQLDAHPCTPPDIDHARPSSHHLEGVNVVFCDGHGMYLSEKLDYRVYCLLMTSNGKRCNNPGRSLPAGIRDSDPDYRYDYFRYRDVNPRDLQ